MATESQDWDALAAQSRRSRIVKNSLLIGFLTLVSIPILLPFFWMLVISLSARTGGVESAVLWRACAVLLPVTLACTTSGQL